MTIGKSPAPATQALPPTSVANPTHPMRLREVLGGEKMVPQRQIQQRGSGFGPSHMLAFSDWHLHSEVVDSTNAGGPFPL